MRSIEPDKINQRIILLASQDVRGLHYYNLKLSLSIKPDILSHRLKRMQTAGLIRKMGSGRDATYYATQKGLEFLKESEKPKRQYVNGRVSKSEAQPTQNIIKRDYAKLYYPLAQPIGRPQLRMCLQLNRTAFKEDALGQLHFKYNLTAELYDNYLMLYSPELHRPADMDAWGANSYIKKLLDEEALKIEALFRANKIPFNLQGFKDRDGNQILVSYFSKQEMAHEQHPFAEATKGGKSKIVLNYSHIDGNEETIIDGSKFKKEGFKEMEAVHRVTAPEVSDIIDKQLSHIEPPTQEDMDAWISGKIKWSDIPEIKKAMGQMSSMLQQSIAAQASLAQQTAQLAKQMNIHAPYLNAWKVVADAINSPEKRAKAKKAIEALSQRKLNEFEG
jgi:DNA-binding HxlR family transcriptional regulator